MTEFELGNEICLGNGEGKLFELNTFTIEGTSYYGIQIGCEKNGSYGHEFYWYYLSNIDNNETVLELYNKSRKIIKMPSD